MLFIENSFSRIQGASSEILEELKAALTYEDASIKMERQQLLKKMAYAKGINNRKLLFASKARFDELGPKEIVCWFDEGSFPTGHLSIVEGILREKAVTYSRMELREVPSPTETFRWNVRPPELRYYQQEMVNLCLNEHRGVLEASVGSGKTNVQVQLVKELEVITLIVLPSSPLVSQAQRVFEKAFGKKRVEVVSTAKVKKAKSLKPIRLVTIQTLASLQKQGLVKGVLQDVHLLILDEFHHAGSASYTNILQEIDHIYYRFGFTGTFLRNDSKTLDMWGFLSQKLYSYPAYKATLEGFLTPVEFMIHELPGRASKKYQKEYALNYGDNPILLEAVQEILGSADREEQILILVDRKDSVGKILHEYLSEVGFANTYISGDDPKEVISEAIQSFNDKEVRILIGSMVIGEGIDLYSTDRLIMARGGKSEIAMVQAIGRAVRLAVGKKKARVHDFHFVDTFYMTKHLKIREEIYRTTFGGDIKSI